MKNFIQCGDRVTVAAPYALSSGQGALVGTLFGVAEGDAANGADVVLATEGVYALTKATGALTVGAAVYWDNTTKNVTTTSSGNTKIGVALVAAQSGDATGVIRLNASF